MSRQVYRVEIVYDDAAIAEKFDHAEHTGTVEEWVRDYRAGFAGDAIQTEQWDPDVTVTATLVEETT